jgi:hypothetical protein
MASKPALTLICLLLLGILTGGCTHFGHYPVNEPLNKYEPGYGWLPEIDVGNRLEGDSIWFNLAMAF